MTRYRLICHTCKAIRGLGLGSYGTWGNVAGAKTAQEFWDSLEEQHKTLGKNIETLNTISTHEGHDFVCYPAEIDDEELDRDVAGYAKEPQVFWEDDPAYEGA
jgi:hypothetical protein